MVATVNHRVNGVWKTRDYLSEMETLKTQINSRSDKPTAKIDMSKSL
jgi:hypothetical protein